MPAVVRIGDSNNGGGIITTSPNSTCFSDGKLIAVNGSKGTGHGPGAHATNAWETAGGSTSVFFDKIEANFVGNVDTCGHARINGSPTNFVGDKGHTSISLLPVEFSIPKTQDIRRIAGKFAPLDDPENISKTPIEYNNDIQQNEITPITENVVTVPKQTEISDNCSSIQEPINYNTMISQNFSIGSFTIHSLFRHSLKAQGGLSISDIVCNLKGLSINILEPLVQKYPNFRINSGFRTFTNGNSQHEKGMAVDIQWNVYNKEYLERAKWIATNLPYDQLIFEHGNSIWLHISYNRTSNIQRKNILTMKSGYYEQGLKLYYS